MPAYASNTQAFGGQAKITPRSTMTSASQLMTDHPKPCSPESAIPDAFFEISTDLSRYGYASQLTTPSEETNAYLTEDTQASGDPHLPIRNEVLASRDKSRSPETTRQKAVSRPSSSRGPSPRAMNEGNHSRSLDGNTWSAQHEAHVFRKPLMFAHCYVS
jgi:hypothetical protein